MNAQQILALVIVAIAALYLGRNFVRSCRAFFSSKSGCSEGCGKCSFAPKAGKPGQTVSSARPNVIPLTDIRTLPQRQTNSQSKGNLPIP